MAHAKPADLKDLLHLLEALRTIDSLKEKSFGCFYFKSKSVLHFHVKGERRFGHVFDGEEWKELDIKHGISVAAQKKLFGKIQAILPFKA